MELQIALVGNPNSGKTTMFNQLTGASQYVGNWPGVTVEKKEGKLKGHKDIVVMDLPGIYSLSPYSPEEVVSRDYLMSGEAGAILNIVDGTSLERNLYLTTQLLEVGLPVVVALNMVDLVRKNGDTIDLPALSEALGCPVVETSALRGQGLDEAVAKAIELAGSARPAATLAYSAGVEEVLEGITGILRGKAPEGRLRWYAVKCFERDEVAMDAIGLPAASRQQIDELLQAAEKEWDDDSESVLTGERYEQIGGILQKSRHRRKQQLTSSDKIDRIVTNRILAIPIFAAVMFLIYFLSIKSVGDLVTGWTNDVLFGEIIGGSLAAWLESAGAAPWLLSLLVDGIIGGVGAVLGFVPQMIILFICLSFLEDVGYMARIAFIMDRIFRRFGLSGKSFIPMMVSMGCAVPGIMSTNTIENEKDRRMTVITTSFIPCGAKLPIIALITGSVFFGAWWVAPIVYFAGVASIILSGIILKKTRMFAGEAAPFVMELPQYHLPAAKSMFMHVWERVRSFVIRAGTVIFLSSIVIWFTLSFGIEGGGFAMVENVGNSFLAMLGGLIAPIFIPLGFGNWESAVGAIAGLVAKENLVSTLAIIQGLSDSVVEGILDNNQPLWAFMQGLLPSAAAGMSFLLFNMLCAPCFAAIGAIRRQMASAKWTAFAVGYQSVYAYCISLMVYQFGTLFAGGGFSAGTVAALIVLAVFLYLLFRPSPNGRGRMRKAEA